MRMDNQDKGIFRYTYSAKQQEEIKKIRSRYLPPEEDKMDQIRRLDAGATQKATMSAIIIGLIGTLLLGTGMSFTMSDIGAVLYLPPNVDIIIGIVIGLVGMAVLATAYPVYLWVIKKERQKIAPEVIRLADELMK